MTTKKHNAKKPKATLIDATIRGVGSQYTSGSWANARATLCYVNMDGHRVTAADERQVLAIAHRLAAAILDITSDTAGWCSPRVELVSSYQDKVIVRIDVELATGSQAELDAAIEVMHDAIPAPLYPEHEEAR